MTSSRLSWVRSIGETLHLLRSPANARTLLASIAELDAGQGTEQALIEPAPRFPTALGS